MLIVSVYGRKQLYMNQGLTQVFLTQVKPAGFFNKTGGFLYEKPARFFKTQVFSKSQQI
jgi:hypothetical protein